MEGLGEGQRPVHGMGGEESETQKTDKSFMKLCCKGQVSEENRVKKGLFFFQYENYKTCFYLLLGMLFQCREISRYVNSNKHILSTFLCSWHCFIHGAHELFSSHFLLTTKVSIIIPSLHLRSLSAEK